MDTKVPRKIVLRPASVWDPNRSGFEHPQPFSQGILAPPGRMVVVAGQVALDKQGQVVGKGDAAAQTEAVLENMKAVLAEAGAHLDHVVRLTVFLTNMAADFPKVQVVRSRYFPKDPPASTTLGISRLVNPDLLVEIDAIAVIPAQSDRGSPP